MSSTRNHIGVIFCVILLIAYISASMLRPPRNDVSNMADALKYLHDLDTFYANVARPRLVNLGEGTRMELEPPELETAILLLRLETIDRIYSKQARSRFGKRGSLLQFLKERNQEDQQAEDYRKRCFGLR